ncbi:hypothetical protein OYE22_30525 [Streptomyces sp. 71268]|nr:hypothetical protein [Streptomyces sp. 71268]WEV29037.1 hypothetical protein OYE22_30525 [Streptomyces sp. 71268]
MNPPHRHDLVRAVDHTTHAEDGRTPGSGSTTGHPTTTGEGAE